MDRKLGSGGTQVRIPWAGSSSCVCFSTKIKKDGGKKDEISPPVAGFLLVSLWHDYHDARRTLNLPVGSFLFSSFGPLTVDRF